MSSEDTAAAAAANDTANHRGSDDDDDVVIVLNIGIVGCGQIVTHHLHAMAQRLGPGKIVIRALIDPIIDNRRRIRDLVVQHGLAYDDDNDDDRILEFDTLSELLEHEEMSSTTICPILFVAVPHDLHETLTKQALHANKIVVLEKPLAPTYESCQTLIEEASSSNSNGMLIVAEQSPYWEEVSMAKTLIADGKIGTQIITASSYYYESMRDNITSGSVDKEGGGGLGWRGSLARAGGGIVIDGGLHWIRPLRYMLQADITKVMGIIQNGLQPQLQMEGESLAHAIFQMRPRRHNSISSHDENNNSTTSTPPMIYGTYSANMLATAPMAHDMCPYFRITGNEGELVIYGDGLFPDDGGGGLRLYNSEYPDGFDCIPNKKDHRKGGFFLGFGHMWMEIYRIIKEQDRTAALQTVHEAAADVSVVLALYRSSASGQWEPTTTTTTTTTNSTLTE